MTGYELFRRDAFFALIIYLLLTIAVKALPIGRDDTDGAERSGMALRIDNRTGCHYLEGTRGGLTPRLNAQGRHVCE